MSASAILRLQRAGFTTEQVEALADFMDTQAASKADLAAAEHRLETRIADTKAELKDDIAALRAEGADTKAELKADIAALRAEIAEVRTDVRLLEQHMTIKLGTLMVVAVGILLAAIRYLPPAAH